MVGGARAGGFEPEEAVEVFGVPSGDGEILVPVEVEVGNSNGAGVTGVEIGGDDVCLPTLAGGVEAFVEEDFVIFDRD